jgi:hypothetical protein
MVSQARGGLTACLTSCPSATSRALNAGVHSPEDSYTSVAVDQPERTAQAIRACVRYTA